MDTMPFDEFLVIFAKAIWKMLWYWWPAVVIVVYMIIELAREERTERKDRQGLI